jgi:sorting nexin-8
MDDPEIDPWSTPELHKNHNHAKSNGTEIRVTNDFNDVPSPLIAGRTMSQHTVETMGATSHDAQQSNASANPPVSSTGAAGGWGGSFYGSGAGTGPNLGHEYGGQEQHASLFGGAGGGIGAEGASGIQRNNPLAPPRMTVGRQGAGPEEAILVTLMPEKEGVFLFQHHNYEVTSQRRGSKVVRRYSDFVWLLDCLHKRYAYRVLPLLPPKRVAVNGNHLSNDNSFIEKRRRGLARFLNALVRHPVLNQEQLVVMFLTVPTVRLLATRRKLFAKLTSTRNCPSGVSRRASRYRMSFRSALYHPA